MLTVATAYSRGIEVEVDKEKAFYWFKKAADLGNSRGMHMAGLMLCDGIGTERDGEKAINFLEKAKEAGESDVDLSS